MLIREIKLENIRIDIGNDIKISRERFTSLKEIGKDSVFQTARTELVEFYIENPYLSG